MISKNGNVTEDHEIANEKIRSRVSTVLHPLKIVAEKTEGKRAELTDALVRHLDLSQTCTLLFEKLSELETRASLIGPLSMKYSVLRQQVDAFDSLKKEVSQTGRLCSMAADDFQKSYGAMSLEQRREVEENINEMTKRKETLEAFINEKKNDIDSLQPLAKCLDAAIFVVGPKLEKLNAASSHLDTPTDLMSCAKQKIAIEVRA